MNLWDLIILALIGGLVWGAFAAMRKGGKRCSGCCEVCGTAACRCKTEKGKESGTGPEAENEPK